MKVGMATAMNETVIAHIITITAIATLGQGSALIRDPLLALASAIALTSMIRR